MQTTNRTASAAPIRAPWWFRLAGQLLEPWIRIKREPAEPAALLPSAARICYVIERGGFTDALILERACQEAGLPSPHQPLPNGRRRSLISLIKRDGRIWGRHRHHLPPETLTQLMQAPGSVPEGDIQIIPVSIYVGRAPVRESGWFRVLFSENWVIVGRTHRLLSILLNGRDTLVHFAAPISLHQVMRESDRYDPARFSRKVARVLRTHFRRTRAAVIGPDLSHRRTMVEAVLNAEPVRLGIAHAAAKEKVDTAKAWQRARALVLEITADYSHSTVRSLSFLLSNFWNKLYDGIATHHFDKSRAVSPGHEVIYVPSHRSHADYVLLSYQLYHSGGVAIPHIAAGANLNLPLIGPLLRRAGAFFIRRSFAGHPLYSIVFKEYITQLIDRGVPVEYFIEGGRSRTGRLLTPQLGVLSMTVRAFLRAPYRPLMFQPIYIGYEKLMEGKAYVGELSGKPKHKESLLGFLISLRGLLKQNYGHVALSFGEPIKLTPLLDEIQPQWRQQLTESPDSKPEWLNTVVEQLAEQIQVNINRAADVNPINLLALVLLATPKYAISENDLLDQLALSKALIQELPYSDRITLTSLEPPGIISYGEHMGWIRRIRHPQGDILVTEGEQAVLLSYFRNNVLHLTVCAAWVASCLLNNRRIARASVLRLGRIIYPYIRSELFLTWDEEGFVEELQATIDFFVRRGLLESHGDGRLLERAPGQDDSTYQLRTLARNLLQAFERYYITLATLVRNGSGGLTTAELEKACTLTAQRLSLLSELAAPEFFDRALFRGFIQQLKKNKVIQVNDAGKLVFDGSLESVSEDAKLILSREIRHAILKIAQNGEEATPPTEPAPDRSH